MTAEKVQTAPVAGKKTQKTKRIVIVVAILLVVALVVVFLLPKKAAGPIIDLKDTTVLSTRDIQNSISGTGIVESAESTFVYSTMPYTVQTVDVEVGDRVEEGQLLAQLDEETIQNQITSQEIGMQTSATGSNQQVQAAQNNYDTFKYNLENGLNTGIISAQAQVDAAKSAVEQAEKAYNRFKETLDLNQNAALSGAEKAYNAAQVAYDAALVEYETAKTVLENAETAYTAATAEVARLQTAGETLRAEWQILQGQLATASDSEKPLIQQQITAKESQISTNDAALVNAQNTLATVTVAHQQAQTAEMTAQAKRDTVAAQYEECKTAYETALRTTNQALSDYYAAIFTARENYHNANRALRAAKKATQDQLKGYEIALENAKANAQNAMGEETLRQLRVDLANTKITAPCAGTVTAVYATVGASGSGLLFVIEDVDNLIIETTINSYDVASLPVGSAVVITSEGSDKTEFSGTLTHVAPTANKNMYGTTDTTGDAVFAAEVTVTSAETTLRIGMEADLDFIVSSEKSAHTVPYDAVYENENGTTCVLTVTKQKDGKYLVEELPVTTGMDNNLDIVITGNGVVDGLRVINNPTDYRNLIGQSIPEGTVDVGMQYGPMAMMGGNQ